MTLLVCLFITLITFMFVKAESASEAGTSRASMNRTEKFNAAKGVQSNYNEYKDFHSREAEAHILRIIYGDVWNVQSRR